MDPRPGAPCFKGIAIVTCAVMKPDLDRLRDQGFLDTDAVFYTSPGNHDVLMEMDRELPEYMREAAANSRGIIVLLGDNCYFNPNNPDRTIDTLLQEIGVPAVRVPVNDCHDMLTTDAFRKDLKKERLIYLMTPGWFKERERLFGHWDRGKINETFPRHDAAVIVDALGFYDDLMTNDPEGILEFCDWMGIPLEKQETDHERLKTLLSAALNDLDANAE